MVFPAHEEPIAPHMDDDGDEDDGERNEGDDDIDGDGDDDSDDDSTHDSSDDVGVIWYRHLFPQTFFKDYFFGPTNLNRLAPTFKIIGPAISPFFVALVLLPGFTDSVQSRLFRGWCRSQGLHYHASG